MDENIIIIDGDFIPYTVCQGNKVLDENGEAIKVDNKFTYNPKTLEEVYKCIDETLLSLFTKIGSFKYIGYLGNGKCFRYDVYPAYKANRKDFVKPEFFKEAKQYLVDKYKFNLAEDLEADDCVLITRNLLKEENIIVTSDKDLIKCTEGLFFNVKTWEIINTDWKTALFNFSCSLITGDTSDNIKGIPGKGIKFAEKLLLESVENNNLQEIRSEILQAYINHFGEYNGILEFTKNYQLLKILTEKEGFVLPEIQEFKI